ncbi:cytochrome c oxidase assembly protein cox15 [Talaromyces proteolyticus]|uniref:Cytochrome c oxidase assembly protein cox15 n=1 Tax=Talaromyces proteolyticus TaxID=1131652 RepID=A0AAD4L5L5_9EURO|nr:cytochrome c oxidase assembly protein cox15 [Talaromyces proteolyticus]KAH8705020.1 cytochrome c oxidase assembly protein cox15 [Talaromyces proteolyticus]
MAAFTASGSVLRGIGARFSSSELFTCRQCLRNRGYAGRPFSNRASTPLSSQQSERLNSYISTLRSKLRTSFIPRKALLSTATTAQPAKEGVAKIKSSFFPDVSSKSVAYWLLGSAVSVFGIVIFGGLTRLTESGLSITEWRPVTGSLPPMNNEDWEAEFTKYRSSPEYKILNPNMNLDEFKSIYYMEWIHRLWGRFVGMSFVIPAVYFVARKKVSKPMALRLAGISGLIGFQGFIGWWMVKSGLKDDLFAPGSHPRVSQYRLTAHLAAAFTCYVAMLWNGLAILRSHRLLAKPAAGIYELKDLKHPKLALFRRSVAGLTLLVFITAMSGALVAGLDAGLIYNEFPYMGNGLTPPKAELFDGKYSRHSDHSDLWWRNMLENPSLVQLDHRILATTTFTAVMALWAYSKTPSMKKLLPRVAKKGVHGVVAFTFVQVALGISTLIYLVPTHLASTHQAGSLFLLTWTLVLGSRVWHPSRTAKLLQMIVRNKTRPITTSAVNAATK